MSSWRLSKDGTNHPSIAQRGVSCSKVELGEPVSSSESWTMFGTLKVPLETCFSWFYLLSLVLKCNFEVIKRLEDDFS